jgi:predicted dehydrogenase
MRVAIIGCGLIGQKRAKAIPPKGQVVICADLVMERAEALARTLPDAHATTDWEAAVQRADVDVAIVSATHDVLAKITFAAVEAGKHVLVEKPAALCAEELSPVIASAEKNRVRVKVGFNHRYHPALLKAKEIADSGSIGPLMFIRGRYGHGGRIGYEKEWRANPAISGGGELIDQGMHLIDLSRWFLGDFTEVQGVSRTYFWNMRVDDNAFLLLQTPSRQVAWLHASWTEWKNLFSFEIFGQTGKLHIEGLGGSYGVERLSFYQMLPQMGPPETTIWEYPFPDESFRREWEDFLLAIEQKRTPSGNIYDARAALQIVERVYRGSR